MYVFLFERVEGDNKMQYRWKVQFKDNQLELIEVPKEVANPYSGGDEPKEELVPSTNSNNNFQNNPR